MASVNSVTQAEGLIFFSVQKEVKARSFDIDYQLPYSLENTVYTG